VQATPLLSVRNLTTHFPLDEGTVIAVEGVSFDVAPGGTLGIVGESGCGKSVTARSILRILDRPGRIRQGEVLFRPRSPDSVLGTEEVIDLTKLKPNSKEMRFIRGGEIGYIFQEPMTAFSPIHTIGNQIMEAIRLHRRITKKEARAQATEMLRRVGIPSPEERIDAYSYQLSGGLRQRALIAMALSCNASLLIADEPTTALDVTTQAQILTLMSDLQKQYGMAVIFITHNLGIIAQACENVVVMYLGRIVESASVDDIFHAPKHPYTQALLRSIPRLRWKSKEKLVSIVGSVPHPYNRPHGCLFHPRCSAFIAGICDTRVPSLLPIGPDHHVSCFLFHGGTSVDHIPQSEGASV
jgi:peptide/nickel transport system ATP-binding protein